jgi:hypothetical protein
VAEREGIGLDSLAIILYWLVKKKTHEKSLKGCTGGCGRRALQLNAVVPPQWHLPSHEAY